MDNLLNDYGQLIEKLRKGRNMSRADLCEGIMSGRNYQRFANGEVAISSDKVVKLVDKLQMEFNTVNNILVNRVSIDSQRINKAFTLATQWKNKDALGILATVDKDNISTEYNKKYYSFTELIANRENVGTESSSHYEKLKKIIDFPNILSFDVLNHIEVNGLNLLCSKMSSKSDRRIIDLLIRVLNNDGFKYAGESTKYTALVYSSVAKALYHIGEYEECIEMCERGIKLNIAKQESTSLPLLFAYMASSYNKLGNRTECINTAIKLYFQLSIEGNEKKSEMFLAMAEKNFDIKFSDIIQIKKGNA